MTITLTPWLCLVTAVRGDLEVLARSIQARLFPLLPERIHHLFSGSSVNIGLDEFLGFVLQLGNGALHAGDSLY